MKSYVNIYKTTHELHTILIQKGLYAKRVIKTFLANFFYIFTFRVPAMVVVLEPSTVGWRGLCSSAGLHLKLT